MKKLFISLDLEEWTDLEYFKKYTNLDISKTSYISSAYKFLEKAIEGKIIFTVFVLASVARRYPKIVRDIDSIGHEVACHGLEHTLLSKMTTKQFALQTSEAKSIIENIIGKSIIGYRAPCFSMNNDKLETLWELGFKYDSSFIRFKEHSLYGHMDMHEYTNKEDNIYEKNNKYVFEMSTLKILGKNIPISGGGYFRLFPLPIMKYLSMKYWSKNNNFIFYIHPFELTSEKLDIIKNFKKIDQIRFSIGREKNKDKLSNFLYWVNSKNIEIINFRNYIDKVK